MSSDLPLLKDKILQTIGVEAVYEQCLSKMLGAAVKLSSRNASGWHSRIKCPFHNDARPSFAVNSISGGFKCWSGACNAQGSFFDFWMEYKGYDRKNSEEFIKALKELADLARIDIADWKKSDQYKVDSERVKNYDQEKLAVEAHNVNLADQVDEARLPVDKAVWEHFITLLGPEEYKYLNLKRGLSKSTIQQYHIGWNPDSFVRDLDGAVRNGRYTLPIFNNKGECRNIRLYSPVAAPEYKIINYKPNKDEEGYGKPIRLLNLHLINEQTETICICEGEFDCILLHQKLQEAGITNWVPVTTTHGSGSFLAEWLPIFAGKSIYFLYDCDEAGIRTSSSHCSQFFLPAIQQGKVACVKNVRLPLDGTKEYKDITDFFIKLGRRLDELLTLIQSTPPLQAGGVEQDEATTPPTEVDNFQDVIKDRKYIDTHVRVPLTISGQTTRVYHAVRSFRVSTCRGTKGNDDCCSDQKEQNIPYGHEMFIHSSMLSKARVVDELKHLACNRGANCTIEVKKKVVMEEHFAHQVVKRWLARENTEGRMENVHELNPTAIYILQPENHRPVQPQDYMATGWVRSHPQTSQVSLFVESLEPLESDWENFEVTAGAIEQLKFFSETDITDILVDISENVTHIYDSPHILLAVLLTYCSPLWISFNHEVTRGWINTCIMGDSGVGKSSTYMRIADFIDIGDLFSVLTGGRTGLLYAIKQSAGQWHVHIGRYVSADRKIIAIDEAQESTPEDIKQMAIAMDRGELDISRVVEATYSTRTRTLFLMNPKGGKTLSSFAHGCMALTECFDPMFIRRLDLAVFCHGRSDKAFYNRLIEDAESTSKLTKDHLRTLVHWTWTRRSENIEWEPDATKHCLTMATELAVEFGDAIDVPLLNATDCRLTIARLASAYAILSGSFTPNYLGCIVTKDHVDAVILFLQTVYNSTECNLAYYSRLAGHKNRLNDYDQIKGAFDKVIKGGGGTQQDKYYTSENLFCQMLLIFRQGDMLRPVDLRDYLTASARWIKNHLAVLFSFSLIEPGKFGYKATPKFNSFMSRWGNEEWNEYNGKGEKRTIKVCDMLDEVYSKLSEKIVAILNNPSLQRQVDNSERYSDNQAEQEFAQAGQSYDHFEASYEDFN